MQKLHGRRNVEKLWCSANMLSFACAMENYAYCFVLVICAGSVFLIFFLFTRSEIVFVLTYLSNDLNSGLIWPKHMCVYKWSNHEWRPKAKLSSFIKWEFYLSFYLSGTILIVRHERWLRRRLRPNISGMALNHMSRDRRVQSIIWIFKERSARSRIWNRRNPGRCRRKYRNEHASQNLLFARRDPLGASVENNSNRNLSIFIYA